MTLAVEASEQVATRMVVAIEAVFERMRAFPFSGAAREQLGRGLRVMFRQPYAIYYLVQADEVVVVRVLHGARDVRAIAERGEL